jgi:hypothetical protein
MISPSQRSLPDNTQHSQQTDIHALGGIRTHNLSRRAAADLRLSPRGYWDRLHILLINFISILIDTKQSVDTKPPKLYTQVYFRRVQSVASDVDRRQVQESAVHNLANDYAVATAVTVLHISHLQWFTLA